MKLYAINFVPLLIVAAIGALGSDLISKEELAKGKIKINKEVVANRQPVDYKIMND